MGDAIAREAKRKRPNPNRDRTEVCDLMPVRFQGMTPVSDGDKKDLWRFIPQRSDAPSAHRRPGYSLSGCTPTPPTILRMPLGRGQLKRAAIHPVDHTHLFDADLHALYQCC